MSSLEEGMRERIVQFLPRAMERAMAAYKFSAAQLHKDGAVMKKHQEACKVSLAHMELLVKLSKNADLSDLASEGEAERKALVDMIRAAQEEIRGGTENGE